ncbi:MBL fold metallo-hydrolase [Fulvimonas soli]|jgi:ribonuclease BN (tRNA processing enzyme)|uniref:Ribonuclease BN (tRNA processing enzyme) n=1 Tax=Fulvimonas soli TaxID=155197 RepID=A0A316I6R0_9GAMM|nr:MBL fold metallo-hydrolase [Fulvimonas soli]PWK88674.1 ribonuclease BN (tRNA processing enzyme) [Fulvimonas soli]TNY26806.1 MBL fold metallo-hydrolase [Fulvimonas soli]
MDISDAPRDPSRRRLLKAGALSAALAACPALLRAADAAPARRSRLVLLGTAGGPTPKAARAAPASAIVVDGAVYVIDCGNGVARQMALAGLDLGAIRGVFITHQHSDHNADYGNLLWLAWSGPLHTRVDTWGPPPLKEMTRLFLAMNDYDIRTRIADEGRPPLAPLIVPHEITRPGPVMQDARVKVTAALVQHPPVAPAFAYRFDCPDRSIVFSGDTRPSDALVALARGADVLVHEVMYLPALEQLIASEPNATRLRAHLLAAHTTTEQLGRIATQAGVKTLVLNHFVPGGHPPVPDQVWHDAVARHFAGRVVVGRDLLEL